MQKFRILIDVGLNPCHPYLKARVFLVPYLTISSNLALYCSKMLSMAIHAPNFTTFSSPSTSKLLSLPQKPFLSFNARFKRPRFVCRPCAAPEALEIEEEDQLEEKEVSSHPFLLSLGASLSQMAVLVV